MPGGRRGGGGGEDATPIVDPTPVDGQQDDGNAPPTLDLTDPVITALLNMVVGGSGGGGSSSGGGSSGGAPVDPQVGEAASFYFQLWGKVPPAGYVQHFLNGETDVFDFIRFQLSRPGPRKTRFYANALSQYAAQAASIMGRR